MNLETAHICCIGSGATASEALKNLVLPSQTLTRSQADSLAARLACSLMLSLPHSHSTSSALLMLLLSDVGHFTIIDHAITSVADKNNNFFVEVHSVGQPRAEVVKEMLLEMNSEVKGDSVVQVRQTIERASDKQSRSEREQKRR